jgi:hypothetical protein
MVPWQRLDAAVLQLALIGAAVFGLVVAASAAPAFYSGAEIRGWVVDAQTQQPLEGVHVVAQWILSSGIVHGEHVTRLQILETVTDAKGEYYLPPWGPKPRPFLSVLEWGFDPILTFFKPGYRPDGRDNYSPPPDDEAELSQRISLWHGKPIALEPFRGSTKDWAIHLSGLQSGLGWGHETDGVPRRVNDYWKHMPRMVLAIAEQCRILPGPLKYRVRDLEAWRATDAQLRELIKQGGTTR